MSVTMGEVALFCVCVVLLLTIAAMWATVRESRTLKSSYEAHLRTQSRAMDTITLLISGILTRDRGKLEEPTFRDAKELSRKER